MEIILVAAMAEGNVIGNNNQLIWHFPNDLKRFKNMTRGYPIIMGRKTFESIGKPLPERENIVLSRDERLQRTKGIRVFHSVESLLSELQLYNKIFVIGGEQIYRAFWQYATQLEITRIAHAFEGDAFFPTIEAQQWKVSQQEFHEKDERHSCNYTFLTYIKSKN